jgi:hypothetical protein
MERPQSMAAVGSTVVAVSMEAAASTAGAGKYKS